MVPLIIKTRKQQQSFNYFQGEDLVLVGGASSRAAMSESAGRKDRTARGDARPTCPWLDAAAGTLLCLCQDTFVADRSGKVEAGPSFGFNRQA